MRRHRAACASPWPDSSMERQAAADSAGAAWSALLSLACILHLVTNYGATPGCREAVLLMALEAAVMLALAACCRRGFYARHRVCCILIVQSVQFLLSLRYLPLCFAVSVDHQLATGRASGFAANTLVSGMASFNICLQVLAVRLPLAYAAPVTAAKVVVAAVRLAPIQAIYVQQPVVFAILGRLKGIADITYSHLVAALTLVNVQPSALAAAGPCPRLAFCVWIHLCVAGLLPIYVVFILSQRRQRPLQQEQQELQEQQLQGDTRTFNQALQRSMQDGCAGTSAGVVPDLADKGPCSSSSSSSQSSSSSSSSSDSSVDSPCCSLGTFCRLLQHFGILLVGSMVLWSAVDGSVAWFAEAAAKHGLCA